jgi:tetratricopeptide (TPR) repeat protein
MTIADRYQLHETIGRGAMGIVHRATDRLTGDVVALKQITLAAEKLQFASRRTTDSVESLYIALATEFQILASLRHPHIISVLDYGFGRQRHAYFTMTYLPEAQNILEAGAERSITEKVDLLLQMLEALVYLHRRGVLHRDLKSDNVLVAPADGRLRVLDFGLSATVQEAHGRVGTPSYMAPEVIRTGQASEVADLYAVGVLAYQLFAGRLPFQDLRGVLTRPPDTRALSVDDSLSQVVTRLLEKSPADRYPDAQSAIAALQEAVGAPPRPEDPTIRESFLQAARFVGRDAELRRLTDALEKACSGQGSAWLVGGESGAGKSRLLEELRIRALVRGAQVLRGQAVEGGGRLYQLWREPLRRLVLSVELSDLEAGVLEPVIPGLEELLGRGIPAVPELEGQAAQQRLVLTIAGVFLKAAQSAQPLVLILEDLHWSIESLEPIKALNRLVAETPILVIGSYRSEERSDLSADLPGMSTLPLPRLQAEHIAELSVSMLGRPGSQPRVLDLLRRETEGNAFFLVETVRALAEEAGRLAAVGTMELPETVFAGGVQQIVRRRLARIPEQHQPLLKLAAVAGRALDLEVLQAARPQARLETWLTACANVAVLEVQEGNWRFTHDTLRDVLTAGLDDRERLVCHRQVAEAYERVYPDDFSHAGALTEHWDAAGEQEKTVYYARIAGEYAAAQYANADAVRFISQALALTPECDVTEQYALYLAREGIYGRLGRREAQAADLDRLTALAGTVAQQAAVALHYGAYYDSVGDYEAATLISEQAYQWAAESGDGASQAQAMVNSGRAHMQQGAYEMATQRYQRAYELAQAAAVPTQIARAWDGLGEVAYRQGDYPTATHYHQQALHLRREIDDRSGQVQSLRNLGQVANAQGEYETARDHYLQALLLAQQMGDRPHEGRLLLDLGRSDWRQGAYQRAEAYLQQSLTMAQTTGDRRTAATSLRNLGIVASQQGQYAQAVDYWEQCLDICQEIGDRDGAGRTLNNLGLAATYQGQYDKAMGYYEQSLVISREIGDRAMEGNTLNNLGLVTMYQGQYDKATGYYEQSLAISQEIGDRAGTGRTLNNLGLVATYQGRPDKATGCYEQSLVISREIGDRAEEGRTLNNLGFAAYSQGQYDRAIDCYEQSLVISQEIGSRGAEGDTLNNLGLVTYSQGDHGRAMGYYEQSLAIRQEIGDRDGEGGTLNNLGAVALARSAFQQARTYYQRALTLRQELDQPQYLVEDWAGLALVALRQSDLETAGVYAGQLLPAWADNPTFEGAAHPMRAFHFTWQVCQGLGLAQADEVLTSAAQVQQTYLEDHPDPAAQAAYLRQPHHRPMWAAWQARQRKARESSA